MCRIFDVVLCFAYINDVFCLPGNGALEVELVRRMQKNNLKFNQTCSPYQPSDLQFHHIFAI